MSPPWNAAVASVQAWVTDPRSVWAVASMSLVMPFGSAFAAARPVTFAVIAWTRPGRLPDRSFQAATSWSFFAVAAASAAWILRGQRLRGLQGLGVVPLLELRAGRLRGGW